VGCVIECLRERERERERERQRERERERERASECVCVCVCVCKLTGRNAQDGDALGTGVSAGQFRKAHTVWLLLSNTP
jgi:hypothetical protein